MGLHTGEGGGGLLPVDKYFSSQVDGFIYGSL